MTRDDYIELEICTTCLLTVANGVEDGATQAAAEALAANWEGYLIAPGNGEGHFSWTYCDGCDSPLGGDRHKATAMPIN